MLKVLLITNRLFSGGSQQPKTWAHSAYSNKGQFASLLRSFIAKRLLWEAGGYLLPQLLHYLYRQCSVPPCLPLSPLTPHVLVHQLTQPTDKCQAKQSKPKWSKTKRDEPKWIKVGGQGEQQKQHYIIFELHNTLKAEISAKGTLKSKCSDLNALWPSARNSELNYLSRMQIVNRHRGDSPWKNTPLTNQAPTHSYAFQTTKNSG